MIDTDFRWGVEAQQGEKREDWLHGWTVDTYKNVLENLYLNTKKDRRDKFMEGEELEEVERLREFARTTWPRVRESRLFEIDPDDVLDILDDITHTFTDDVDRNACLEMIPDHFANLPFDYCFLGFGPGLQKHQSWFDNNFDLVGGTHADKLEILRRNPRGYVAGFMVSSSSIWKFTIVLVDNLRGGEMFVASNWDMLLMNNMVRRSTRLHEFHEMLLVEELLHSIRDAQQVVLRPKNMKHKVEWKRAMKGSHLPKQFKKVPPPYYLVRIKPKVIREKTAGAQQTRLVEWSHRWDCEGHYRHRVLRGPLPVPPDQAIRFERETKNGNRWLVCTTEDPPTWVQELLEERGMAKKDPREWLAVLRWWVDAHIRGPEDKPYVPASRKLDFKLKKRQKKSA